MRVFHDTRQKSRPVGRDWCRGSGTTRILPNEPSRALVSDFTSRKKPKFDVKWLMYINNYASSFNNNCIDWYPQPLPETTNVAPRGDIQIKKFPVFCGKWVLSLKIVHFMQ